jgi:PRC-barrel domain
MYQTRNIKRTIWVVASLFLFSAAASLYAAGQQWNKQTSRNGQMQQQQASSQMTVRESLLLSAKDLIGSDVRSTASTSMNVERNMGTMGKAGKKPAEKTGMKQRAEKIGTVKELIFDNSRDRVDCVVVASQKKYYPVPWWAFEFREAGSRTSASGSHVQNPAVAARYGQSWLSSGLWTGRSSSRSERPALFLNITKEQFRQAPSIASISLERLRNVQLNRHVRAFYSRYVGMESSHRQMGYMQPEMQAAQSSPAKEGSMQEKARPQATAPASPIFAGPADLARASKVIGLKVQDPRYDGVRKIQDVLIDARGGHLAYGLVSFGGFVGIGEKSAAVPWSVLTIRVPEGFARLDASRQTLEAAAMNKKTVARLAQRQYARQIYNDFGVEPYWQVFGYVPGEETKATVNPWLPDSKYNKCFDVSKLTTAEGTIESVGTFYPESGAAPGTSLTVKTKKGASVTVYAGPRSFTMHKGIDLTSGKSISITGCKTMVNGKSVIIASELDVGGKTLRLRDQHGRPEWNTEWSR